MYKQLAYMWREKWSETTGLCQGLQKNHRFQGEQAELMSEQGGKNCETQIDSHPKATLPQLDSIHILPRCKIGPERHLSLSEQNTSKKLEKISNKSGLR